MNQHQFEEAYSAEWVRFEWLLASLEDRKPGGDTLGELAEYPAVYRTLCNHYSLARVRHYSPALVDRLHDLVLRGHRHLYKRRQNIVLRLLVFISRTFPVEIRRQARFFWLSFLLFYGSAAAVGWATYNNPELIFSIMGESQVISMEEMYDPANKKIGRSAERSSETDVEMFGFYIFNNISIGLRTFALGLTFGVGTVLLLVFNGLMLGSVAGYLSHPPFYTNFWQFVPGHGAFELMAIVISGAAGLHLGAALIAPGGYRRRDSLRRNAPTSLVLGGGASLFFFIAAFIEAFWSSSQVEPSIKYGVAATNFLLVALYLLFAGRSHHES